MYQKLQQYFGFESFREGQESVIRTLLNAQSAAAIFPTGSGKSLCYQLPALCLPHLTLVVSPLLALIQDQLDFLHQKGIAADSIQSMQSAKESADVYRQVTEGKIKILFISVERLNSERFRLFLKTIPISLLVVDEAHCISEWGHNFRPDYLKLAQYRAEFNIPQVLLLTATATSKVIADMANKFSILPENITQTGSYRSNLHLEVLGVSEANKLKILFPWLACHAAESGIVYVTLQHTAQYVAQSLTRAGIPAEAYHAGMNSDKRIAIQQRFMSGELPLIVATIAFGMGIDKSNIRFVVHYDLPKSIENYAQEIGRAGRDGYRSHCLLLANISNINVLENFVYSDTPEAFGIDFILSEMTKSGSQWEVLMNSLSDRSNIRLLALKTLLVYLELEGVLRPAYSYYAEYRYKLLVSENQLLARFKGERLSFIQAILHSSDKARTWASLNFEKLSVLYHSPRSRVITAIDYLAQQGFIELQNKQMTLVYHVTEKTIDNDLKRRLLQRFLEKEQSEIQRIHFLIDFFSSERCLNLQLAEYFSDPKLKGACLHCSVCAGNIALMPEQDKLCLLNEFDFYTLSQDIQKELGLQNSATLIARFFCGLNTPIFKRLKVRKFSAFAQFSQYRFAQVKKWVEAHMKA